MTRPESRLQSEPHSTGEESQEDSGHDRRRHPYGHVAVGSIGSIGVALDQMGRITPTEFATDNGWKGMAKRFGSMWFNGSDYVRKYGTYASMGDC